MFQTTNQKRSVWNFIEKMPVRDDRGHRFVHGQWKCTWKLTGTWPDADDTTATEHRSRIAQEPLSVATLFWEMRG